MTVIGSAIGLPASLHWLWRRQWIDLRRWDATRRRKNPVPAVPEGMTRLRLPGSRAPERASALRDGRIVRRARECHFPPESSNSETLTAREGFGGVIAVAGDVLDRRRLAAHPSHDHADRATARWVGLLSWLTLILAAGWILFFHFVRRKCLARSSRGLLRRCPAFSPSAGKRRVSLFGSRRRPAPGTNSVHRLNAPRKWDALLWAFLYMALWMYPPRRRLKHEDLSVCA